MSLIEKIKSVLLQPTKFFENLKKEKGVKPAFMYFLVLSFASAVLGVVVGRAFESYYYGLMEKMFSMPFPMPQQNIETLVIFPLLIFIAGLIVSFLVAGILHVWILIFGGKEDYSKTYQLWVYSMTPGLVFGWIPFLGFFAWIYEIFLLILGTQKIHNISRNKAILMYVIPVVLFVIFMIVCMILMFMFIASNPGLFQNLTYQ